jgi:catechol 2,3-dioxygenase-like lactoylglutathione lyase family enzyme
VTRDEPARVPGAQEGDRIDHLVLTVRSIDATCAFYREALGLDVLTFDDGRRALRVGRQKVNLHQLGHEIEPKAGLAAPGSGDFCIVVTEPIEQVAARLASLRIAVELGPVARTGGQGPIRSIYVRDPDRNLVEVANDLRRD